MFTLITNEKEIHFAIISCKKYYITNKGDQASMRNL